MRRYRKASLKSARFASTPAPINSDYNGAINTVRQWDSLTEVINCYKSQNAYSVAHKSDFYPGSSDAIDKIMQTIANGDESLVPEAEKLMDSLEVALETVGRIWQSDVSGQVLSVPDYLANVPTTFRRMKETVSDVSPIKLYVSSSCAWYITPDQMQRRGVAIMALAMKLQAIRPVEVYLLTELGTNYNDILYSARLESRPISLAHCVNVLANVNVGRVILNGIARTEGFDYKNSSGYNVSTPTKGYEKWRASVLGITESDLVIGRVARDSEILDDPIAWINSHLSLYSEVQD